MEYKNKSLEVKLLHYTPLEVSDVAISKCWDTEPKTDRIGMNDRMYRVANKFKHGSTVEHITYNFDIDGISRACLQELARHRHSSLSVKSTRYTLKELQEEGSFITDQKDSRNPPVNPDRAKKYIVMTGDWDVDYNSVLALEGIRTLIKYGKSNDIAKYAMPECYRTSLVLSLNMRSLQNFLSLRSDKSALWEIRELANKIFEALPHDHRFMLEDFMKDN